MPRTVTSRAVRSYRTLSPLPALARLGGLLSAALSVSSHFPGVTWRSALRSPDFPPPLRAATAEPTPRPKDKLTGKNVKKNRLITPQSPLVELIFAQPRQLGTDGGRLFNGKLLKQDGHSGLGLRIQP